MDTITNITWVAGILEGEGSFQVRKNGGICITCQMTDMDVLERLRDYCEGGKITPLRKRQTHWKDAWIWVVYGKKAYMLAKLLLPHMLSRRTIQIEVMINAYDTSPRIMARQKQQEMREFREAGLTHQAIADRLGVDRSYVSHVLSDRNKN